MAYDFKYIRTGTGELSGPSMIWQTEQALTQIGTYADEANTKADEALETANTALNKANEAQLKPPLVMLKIPPTLLRVPQATPKIRLMKLLRPPKRA